MIFLLFQLLRKIYSNVSPSPLFPFVQAKDPRYGRRIAKNREILQKPGKLLACWLLCNLLLHHSSALWWVIGNTGSWIKAECLLSFSDCCSWEKGTWQLGKNVHPFLMSAVYIWCHIGAINAVDKIFPTSSLPARPRELWLKRKEKQPTWDRSKYRTDPLCCSLNILGVAWGRRTSECAVRF